MKEAEMGTELVDHLTPEERVQLSQLNPQIKDLKEKKFAYQADRIEVGSEKKNKSLNVCSRFELISDLFAFLSIELSLIYVLLFLSLIHVRFFCF